MRHFWLIIATGAFLACIMPAAEKMVNFSGAWVLDPAHSDMQHTPPGMRKIKVTVNNVSPDNPDEDAGDVPLLGVPEARMQNLTLRIAHTNGELQTMRQFTIDGEEQAVTQKFFLDGSQCLNVASNGQGEFISRTTWEKGKLINSGTQTITIGAQRTEISVKEEYSISKDGKRLTIKTSSVTPRGVTHLKQVFNKGRESKS